MRTRILNIPVRIIAFKYPKRSVRRNQGPRDNSANHQPSEASAFLQSIAVYEKSLNRYRSAARRSSESPRGRARRCLRKRWRWGEVGRWVRVWRLMRGCLQGRKRHHFSFVAQTTFLPRQGRQMRAVLHLQVRMSHAGSGAPSSPPLSSHWVQIRLGASTTMRGNARTALRPHRRG